MAKAIETLSIKLDFKAGSGSQQIIDKIGNSIKNLKVITGKTAPSIEKVKRSINDFAKQGNRSISTIEGQVTALRALRREADINSKEFKELTADIGKYEKQLNKAQGRRGGGGGARQATQVAGAVISGGIFGGPEGAIGGALGAFGGVQGAFAGAAIGAQVGGIRKAIGAAADYAAQIGKLKIALEGVTREADEYTSALATAARVSAELNVPQEQAIRGVTRLTAAVKGAGGPVTDAETTFRNVTAAIKATGGSSEDVKGAITAMVQVFSKGKVSAEELSGQLGERLPGAVTMFAKANDKTLPQLQKNLKAGTVGLNELMNFIVQLGVEFDGTAKKIASSNEEAGARLTLAFDNMKARVGDALIGTGAELQNTFAEFIKEITPALVQVLPVIAKAFANVAKNIDKIVVAAAAALAIIAVGKIAAIVASIGGLSAAIFTLKLNAVVAAKALIGLNAAALLNPYTALAAGAAALAVNIYNASEEQKKLNLLLREGSVAEIDKKISEKRLLLAEAETRTLKGGEGTFRSAGYDIKGSGPGMVGFSRKRDKEDIARLREELPKLDEARRLAVYNRDQGAPIPANLLPRFKYDLVTDEDEGGKKGGTGPKDILKAQADALIAANNLRRKGVEITKEDILAQQKIALEATKSLLPQKRRVEVNKINVKTANDIFALEESNRKKAEDAIKKEQEKALALTEIKLVTGEITEEEGRQAEIRQEAFELTKLFPEQFEAVHAALVEAASPLGKFKDGLKEVFESAMDLNTALGEAGVQAVSSFGDAFADFVATGKASFADLTKSILQDLARIFARAAMFQALSAIPGVGSFLGLGAAKGAVTKGMTPPTTIPGGVGAMAANGLAVARNGIVPYAKGGLVTKPTLFQYKQGGVGNYGLMGEAGTEAIMPLRRGANGKLGVEASGGGVSNVVVNVDASGSNVQGDQPNAKALGSAIGAAVQAELVKQKRPGGLLS